MRISARLIVALVIGTTAPLVLSDAMDEEYPVFEGQQLRAGREIWLGTCVACHATDIAGAPQVTDAAAWAPRLRQARETLYAHALNGLHGEMGTEMPPRGGNPSLTDDQVKAAVDYMVTLVAALAGKTQ